MRKRKQEWVPPSEVKVFGLGPSKRPGSARVPRMRGGVLGHLENAARRLSVPITLVFLAGCVAPPPVPRSLEAEARRGAIVKAHEEYVMAAQSDRERGKAVGSVLDAHGIIRKLGLMKNWPRDKPFKITDLTQVKYKHPDRLTADELKVLVENCSVCHQDEKGYAFVFPHPDVIKQALAELPDNHEYKGREEAIYQKYLKAYEHFQQEK